MHATAVVDGLRADGGALLEELEVVCGLPPRGSRPSGEGGRWLDGVER